jgi:uncharacterized protein DUF3830
VTRQIVYEFTRGGRVRATLLEDRAPRTCAAILAALPHEADVLHARWAGREVFLPMPLAGTPPMEHQVNRVSAGDVIYFREWEGLYEHTGFETMGLFYAAEIVRDWRGEARANWVARILPEDLDAIGEIGLRIWRQGGERVRVSVTG